MLRKSGKTKSVSKNESSIHDNVVRDLSNLEYCVSDNSLPSQLVVPHSLHRRNGSLIHASEKLSTLLSADISPSRETCIADLIQVQDRVTFLHTISSACDDGIVKTIQVRRNTAENGPVWIEIMVQALDEVDGRDEPLVLASYRDVSNRKDAEEKLQRSQLLAEEANRAKSQFLANTSHELRTPLNAILGFSELLISPIMTDLGAEKRLEYASLINDSAQHLLSVLNGILDMSKIEAGKYEIFTERFDLSKSIKTTVAIMQGQAHTKNIELEYVESDEIPEIIADEKAIRQIVINLLSNAIKFSHENSNVLVMLERKARSVTLTVKDHGIGMSAENTAKLGKPFFQADSKYNRNYEGTGLGLSVVKGLVELHEGQIIYDSQKDVGTSVKVILPIHGKPGRRQPVDESTEKVTSIRSNDKSQVLDQSDAALFNLTRNVS